MTKQIINITLDRYKELFEAEQILEALRKFGVDNWEGYDDAISSLIEDEDD